MSLSHLFFAFLLHETFEGSEVEDVGFDLTLFGLVLGASKFEVCFLYFFSLFRLVPILAQTLFFILAGKFIIFRDTFCKFFIDLLFKNSQLLLDNVIQMRGTKRLSSRSFYESLIMTRMFPS